MLMMCWFYCVPLAKGLFFAASPLLIIVAFFILKRGVRQSRRELRQAAFFTIFIAFLKMLTIDIYLSRDSLLCGVHLLRFGCNATGFKILQMLALFALAPVSFFLFNVYRGFIRDRKQPEITPKQVHLTLWANLSLASVLVLVVWLAAPWIGYLTVGHAPQLFMRVPWQLLAAVNILVLLTGFWKLEDCSWIYHPAEHTKKKYAHRVWTPKDTLGLSVILFLIAFAFSYVSSDVLSPTHVHETGPLDLDKIDFSNFGQKLFSSKEEAE
ncbi:MAG: hypothetical protein HY052_07050 [Proteobacteria bacterium]|nr:hypothetical protein [Pseudomonadota bacterium]